jgi:uncharacterized membrane protein YeaQ/YmgE (transglycosylase-associated protein family)
MAGWLTWIVVGLIAGFLAGVVVRGGGFGIIWDIIIGILGGLLGGWLATSVFHIGGGVTGINWPSILIAFLGAVLLLFILRLIRRRA